MVKALPPAQTHTHTQTQTQTQTQATAPLFVGDQRVLDFLNTVQKVEGELVDSLQSDEDVVHWLGAAGLPVESPRLTRPPALLRAARMLRETVRAAIERRKRGKPVDVSALNAFLAPGQSHLVLLPGPRLSLRTERRWEAGTAEQVLAPLAEAAAELLETGDFDLVRKCEDEQCVLWFYDRTKSHRRRWCSMAVCGNRNKVAAFRERQQRESGR